MKRFYEHWKELSAGVLLALACVFFLFMFVLFEIRGHAIFWEPNAALRRTELGVISLVTVLAVERLIRDFHKLGK